VDVFSIVLFILFILVFLGVFLRTTKSGLGFLSSTVSGKHTWFVIGISVIAANISSEQIVGMAGSGYQHGFAVSNHEWTAAIALVVISLYVLPKFMSVGIKTVPEYLEYRFNHWLRLTMAILMILVTLLIQFSSTIYAGSISIESILGFDHFYFIGIFAIVSALITLRGGASSVVKTNVFFAISFLLGSIIITIIALTYVGGIEGFINASQDKLVVLLPSDNNFMPWTSALVGGLWVAQFYFFGFNQYITQYLLSSNSLSDAQKGVLFAASLKLLIPFIAILPGIVAFELVTEKIENTGLVYAYLIEFLSSFNSGIEGLVLVILFAAVLSSLNAMLIACSDIFVNDVYMRYLKPDLSAKGRVQTTRIVTIACIFIGCFWAPFISKFPNSFEFVQKFAGMISPGILCVFLLALFFPRIPNFVPFVGLGLSIVFYWLFVYFFPAWSLYDTMGATFVSIFSLGLVLGKIYALPSPVQMPERFEVKFERNLMVVVWSLFLGTFILFLYSLFS
jgi:solute:Na+ symporter, SSS family